MLLLFRFLFTILRSLVRRRIEPLGESVVRFTALPNDCDLNLHLNAGRFVSFMDIARVELIGRVGLLVPMLRRGWRPVMGGATVTYRRSILPFERFTIRTRVAAWDEKWFYVAHTLLRHDGSVSATGIMRTAIRSKEGVVPPRDVLALIGAEHLQSPEVPA
ncbi:MAG TPA: acyl-CoA thioesterase [Thermoanaerobaculia bacterium]|nr:acyl-CoA thioesterase [Thermoanaerobaculia bacterium]